MHKTFTAFPALCLTKWTSNLCLAVYHFPFGHLTLCSSVTTQSQHPCTLTLRARGNMPLISQSRRLTCVRWSSLLYNCPRFFVTGFNNGLELPSFLTTAPTFSFGFKITIVSMKSSMWNAAMVFLFSTGIRGSFLVACLCLFTHGSLLVWHFSLYSHLWVSSNRQCEQKDFVNLDSGSCQCRPGSSLYTFPFSFSIFSPRCSGVKLNGKRFINCRLWANSSVIHFSRLEMPLIPWTGTFAALS